MKKWLLRILVGLIVIILILAAYGYYQARSRGFLRDPVYDQVPPEIGTLKHPAVLVVSKTNSFIHKEAIPAAESLIKKLGEENGWSVYITENGAVHNDQDLARFDTVIWNNVTGDILTESQKDAFKRYLKRGGGWIGLHGAGDNSHSWPWYVDTLIGATFIGHPMDPQFQEASVIIESPESYTMQHLSSPWQRVDEWYSFASSPRSNDRTILATLDESTYIPEQFGKDMRMGDDHPIVWQRCVEKGRAFYSAMGHTAESFNSDGPHIEMLKRAIEWTAGLVPNACQDNKIDDDYLNKPYVDIDEWRTEPEIHRYVHGGFTGTDTRFSFYFPAAERFEGRFFQYVTPVPIHENLAQGATGEENRAQFAWHSGAYFVETNGGGKDSSPVPGSPIDPAIGAYRANAAAATFSRQLAYKMYGTEHIYGYLSGGSGGAYRTIGGLESAPDVWDGAVPYVMGSPMAIPNVFTARLYAYRVLGDKLDLIADAYDAGGSGNVDALLNKEELAAFKEVSGLGFPLTGWHEWRGLGMHAFPILYPTVMWVDNTYRDDFWNKPGYEGYQMPTSLKDSRFKLETTILTPLSKSDATTLGFDMGYMAGEAHGTADDSWKQSQARGESIIPVGLQLAELTDKNLQAISVTITSGEAKGASIQIKQNIGTSLLFGPGDASAFAKVKPGDSVLIDNSDFLAVQTYHRHQVPGQEYAVWDQFRNKNGRPKYPQRPMLLGPSFTQNASGKVPEGNFTGKAILVENGLDTEAFAWQGDWYRQRVIQQQGDDSNNFRLWYSERTNHGDTTQQKDPTYTVSYLGMLQRALHDVAMWVEKDIAPAATSGYTINEGQLVLSKNADTRHGIQALVKLSADGADRVSIQKGESVQLMATITPTAGSGPLVDVAWDFGDRTYPVTSDTSKMVFENGEYTTSITSPSFNEPGTYFVTVKIATQHEHYQNTPFAKVQNLARVRVVVE